MATVDASGSFAVTTALACPQYVGSGVAAGAGYDSWVYGGITFPLTASSGNTLLQDADPGIFYALDYFSFVAQKYLGARFAAACAAAGYRTSDGSVVSSVYSCRVPYDPTPQLVSAQYPLPLLALYRKSAKGDYTSTVLSRETTTWGLMYVMPPMDASQGEQLLPFLHALELLFENRTERGFDPTYTPPGAAAGTSFVALSGLAEIEWLSCEYGYFEKKEGEIYFPMLLAELEVREVQGPYLGATVVPFAGADIQIPIAAVGQTTTPTVVAINTTVDPPPWGAAGHRRNAFGSFSVATAMSSTE